MTGGFGLMSGRQTMTRAMTGSIGTMHASMTADQRNGMGTIHASVATSGTHDSSGR